MKKIIVILLSALFLCSCSGVKKMSMNHPSCNGVRPKGPVYTINYYKMDIYRRYVYFQSLQQKTARKASNSYSGIYRY